MAPSVWAMAYMGNFPQGNLRKTQLAKVTAGLIWAPEMPEA